MANFAPIDVDSVLLATTDTIVGQVPAGKSWAVARVNFCNTDTVDRQVTIGTATGSLDDTHSEQVDVTIQAKSSFEWGPAYLPAGRKILAKASVAAKVSARIHGLEKTP